MNIREKNIVDACLSRLDVILEDAGLGSGKRSDLATQGFDPCYHVSSMDLSLMIEVKQSFQPYLVDKVVAQARQRIDARGSSTHERIFVLTSKLSRSVLEKCVEVDICVLDEEGNGYLRLPGLYYHKFVHSKKGVSSSRGKRSSVFSAKASRLVRAMLSDYPETWNQTELAKKTMVNPGYVSTIIGEMIDADYIRRDKNKLRVVDPNRFMDDWAAAYRFDRHRRSRFAIGMGEYQQGLRKFQQEMNGQDIRFAFTGWSAAYLRSPYGMPDSIVAYVDRLTEDIPFKSIHPVESKGNVLLLLPNDEGVFQFSQPGEFGDCVSDVQCYLDLLGLPGRASDQAEALRDKKLAFWEVNDG